MSIFVTSLVWKFSRAEGSTLLTALAIADFADDDGRAYPSVATLAKKARISERSVQYACAELKEMCELAIEHGTGPKGCNTYVIQVQNLRGANSAGVQNTAQGGEAGCTQTVIEPSEKKEKKPTSPPIGWDLKAGCFTNITDEDRTRWAQAYPNINCEAEITRAACWVVCNPSRLKKDNRRFLNNWLSKAFKDVTTGRAPRVTTMTPAAARDQHRDDFAAALHGTHPKGRTNDFIDVVATEVQ